MYSRIMKIVAWGLVCSLCLAAWGASEEERPYEWPQLKGDSGFTGLSPDDSVKPPLKSSMNLHVKVSQCSSTQSR